MKLHELNRWSEFWCVLNGHDFNERYEQKQDNGFVLQTHHTCGNCGLTVKDESGILKLAKEKYGLNSGSGG